MSVGSACLDKKEHDLVERLIVRLRDDLGTSLKKVLLYGSKARGEGRPDSDIDLMVVVEGEGAPKQFSANRAAVDLALELDLSIPSVKVFGESFIEQRRKIDSFFIQEVNRDGIQLFP